MDEYFARFNKILSNLRSVDFDYAKNYSDSDVARHLFSGLDMSIWEIKVTSIQDSVDMCTITLDNLFAKLKTHELNMFSRKHASKSMDLISSPSNGSSSGVSSLSLSLSALNSLSDEHETRLLICISVI